MAGEQTSEPDTAPTASSANTTDTTAPIPGEREGNRGSEDGHKFRSAATSAAEEEVDNHSHRVSFDLITDVAYHAMREQFLARLNRFLTGTQVFLGTSAVAAMIGAASALSTTLVLVSAFAGVLLLVLDPAGGARDHRAYRTRLQGFRVDLEIDGHSIDALRKAESGRLRVGGEAPPAYRAVLALAYNAAVNALYEESVASGYRYRVVWYRRWFANWFPMRGFNFEKNAC